MAADGAGQGRLVAVVVTYNRLAELRITLPRLLEADPAHLQKVVVVDNASTDGTGAWLAAQEDARLEVLRLAENGGGAGGFAAGMARAVALGADWMLLQDDDARPAPGALAVFHGLDLAPWDAVAAAVYHPDGRICAMNRPLHNPAWRLRDTVLGRSGLHLGAQAYDGPAIAVDAASFVGFFVSRRAVDLAGYPDTRLFLYGDDGLFSLALRRAGGRIGFQPALRYEHDPSTFGTGAAGALQPLWKVYYYYRNLLLFYRLAAGALFWPLLPLLLARWIGKMRLYHGQKRVFLQLLSRAVGDGLTRHLDRPHAEILARAGTAR